MVQMSYVIDGLVWLGFFVFNATFNNISAISLRTVLIGGGNRSTRRKSPTFQTLSHNIVSSTPRHERGSNSQL